MTRHTNIWLLNQKAKSVNKYNDILGKEYNYDSDVSNSKQLSIDDTVIIRLDEVIYGYGIISDIIESVYTKTMKACPHCSKKNHNIRS